MQQLREILLPWSLEWDLNPRSHPYQGCAFPLSYPGEQSEHGQGSAKQVLTMESQGSAKQVLIQAQDPYYINFQLPLAKDKTIMFK